MSSIKYAFDAAIMQYMAVVGHDQVLQNDALAEYIDPYELYEAEGKRKMPSAAVRPKNVEELRGVMKISNEYSIPVWTFSRGKNLGYVAILSYAPMSMRHRCI
jgi:FAD/FMN-containing dehydrogenase